MKIFRSSDKLFIFCGRMAQAALGLLLAACTTASPTAGPSIAWTPTPPAAGAVTPTPATPPPSATPAAGATTLRVWLPPDFAPDASISLGGKVLAAQLAQFEQAHANVVVETRIKAVSGPGGLLHALTTAYNVAPAILPNVIALNHDDLAAAAAAGLVLPLDKFFPSETLSDYYPFAQAMSRSESGDWVGLPFAADAPVLVYNTNFYATSPLTWTTVATGTLILPGAEGSALTVLDEYMALGGPIADGSGKLALNAEILAKALSFFSAAREAGILPMSTLAYSDSAATWQAFRDGHATLTITSAGHFLAEYDRAPLAAATLIPAPGGKPLALAQGWSWAIVNTMPERQPEVAALLAWLNAPPQLSAWTQAAAVLPTRTSVLTRWAASPRVTFAEMALTQAQLQPADKILSVIGPPLQQALADVLNQRATTLSAAAAVVQAVDKP